MRQPFWAASSFNRFAKYALDSQKSFFLLYLGMNTMWYLHMYLVCARLSYSIKNTPVGALDGSLWEYFFHIQQFLANSMGYTNRCAGNSRWLNTRQACNSANGYFLRLPPHRPSLGESPGFAGVYPILIIFKKPSYSTALQLAM